MNYNFSQQVIIFSLYFASNLISNERNSRI